MLTLPSAVHTKKKHQATCRGTEASALDMIHHKQWLGLTVSSAAHELCKWSVNHPDTHCVQGNIRGRHPVGR